MWQVPFYCKTLFLCLIQNYTSQHVSPSNSHHYYELWPTWHNKMTNPGESVQHAGKGAHEELWDCGVLILLFEWFGGFLFAWFVFCGFFFLFNYVWNIWIFQEIIYDQFISICWNVFRFLSALSVFWYVQIYKVKNFLAVYVLPLYLPPLFWSIFW